MAQLKLLSQSDAWLNAMEKSSLRLYPRPTLFWDLMITKISPQNFNPSLLEILISRTLRKIEERYFLFHRLLVLQYELKFATPNTLPISERVARSSVRDSEMLPGLHLKLPLAAIVDVLSAPSHTFEVLLSLVRRMRS